NSSDTISREYIYYSYIFSGRNADAGLFLESLPSVKRNNKLKLTDYKGLYDIYAGLSGSGYDVALYETNNLNYEAVERSSGFNAGFETFYSGRLKGTFAYSGYQKEGTVYSPSFPSGTNLDLNQNQFYARLTRFILPGWEISWFGHGAFYSDIETSSYQKTFEYLGGAGVSKNGWKIRTGANFSLSNFSYSQQIRSEAYLTWLPAGNMNLYLTSGWMGQSDKNWGGTYQINQEIGFRVFKFLWLESGIVSGNSFLYARNYGYSMNNSFQIPATQIYGNIIVLPGKHFKIIITPFYSENQVYSWDLKTFTRTNKLILNSFGGSIKLIYKTR
ncbi:MAG: hypothetical protein C0408_07905, partial [Odoribacter sp.]|nr:hypothetical protein [Odoribacter sp.]